MKNKKLLATIIIVLAIILVAILVAILFLPKTNISGPHGGKVEYNNQIVAITPTLMNTEDVGSLENQIKGIPSYMFNATSGRSFDFSIKDNRDGYVFKLIPGVKLGSFGYKFLTDPDPSHKAISDPIIITIEPGKTALNVEGDYDKPNDIFVFGGLNETNETITGFDLSTCIYVSYRGSSDWTLCGLNTTMNRDDVVNKYGEPTQEMPSEEGIRMEYYILNNNHTYILTAILNEETNMVQKIEWSMDNYPVFVNNIVPDNVIMDN